MREYVDGERSLPADVRDVLASGGFDAASLRDLSASALLAKLATVVDGPLREKLETLSKAATELDAR